MTKNGNHNGKRSGNKAARTLGHHGQTLYDDVMSQRHLTDVGELELLLQACQGLDRAEELRERINKDGLLVPGRNGNLVANPLLKLESLMRGFVCRTLRSLGLHVAADKPKPRLGRPTLGGVGWIPDDHA
jgi:hypothetical protein